MSIVSLFYDLCRYPKWQIDNIEISTASVKVYGWALPFERQHTNSEIFLNGKYSPEFKWLESPDLKTIFPYLDGSSNCRFSAKYLLKNYTEILHFSQACNYTADSVSQWTDIYFPVSIWSKREYISPESNAMNRTQGHDSIFRYVMFGFTVAVQLNNVLKVYFGTNLSCYKRICDWGVGCGRVTQMVHSLAPRSNIFGLDVDAENIKWCNINLSYGQYETVPLYPPTYFASNEIDLVYGISVCTHLKIDALEMWIFEISRMLRRGGVALITIASGASLVGLLGRDIDLVNRVLQSGFDDNTRDNALDSYISDNTYYRSTFLTHSKAREIFSKHFQIRDIVRQFNASSQDLIVCQKL